MEDLIPVRRAILSVSDKAGIVEFARSLEALGVEIISTGGTARALSDAGIQVRSVEELTGFPEMMDGRVKTLHPAVHGGLLAIRTDQDHVRAMQEHAIDPIDLICINLYPFEATVAKPGVTDEEAIEQIDIGGPSMIRSGAKNHRFVAVATDPSQYEPIIRELREHSGKTTLALRRSLARSAFERTSAYDSAIASYMLGNGDADHSETLPQRLTLTLDRVGLLRYGENPHQHGATYREAGASLSANSLVDAQPLHGKALSYNNLNDAQGAVSLAVDLLRFAPERTSAVVVKHTNPCGACIGADTLGAIEHALAGDPMAAYGGILATSGTIDDRCAARLCEQGVFLEVVISADYTPEALARLRERWANLRLLAIGHFADVRMPRRMFRSVSGGMLVQTPDDAPVDVAGWEHRAGPAPDADAMRCAGGVWLMCKHLTSNAIAIGCGADGGSVMLFGAGAGQMDRVSACRNAIDKAGERARGAIAASDAFFPFPDAPELLIDAGVSMIVHPGGSKRDEETFRLCEQRGVTCLTTGTRHFRH